MTFKEIVVLIGTLAGIYANLLFQDSLAEDDVEARMMEKWQVPSPQLQSPRLMEQNRPREVSD